MVSTRGESGSPRLALSAAVIIVVTRWLSSGLIASTSTMLDVMTWRVRDWPPSVWPLAPELIEIRSRNAILFADALGF
jgi:hypothetical protein